MPNLHYRHSPPPRVMRLRQTPNPSHTLLTKPLGDLNLWNAHNPSERFWAARTRQLHATHVSTYDRLWSTLPHLRPRATILADSLAWYGVDAHGGRVHDLLGTRCDPYVNTLLSGEAYDFHCHSNLVRAVLPFGLAEADVHDVLNLFQVTGLNDEGRYCMSPCPARKGDYIEMLAEVDLLLALSEFSMFVMGWWSCCRPLNVKVFRLEDESLLRKWGWKMPEPAPYRGLHGMTVPQGEARL
ncbi:meiotic chromosome segregation protein [Mycena vulgaris]|nr:meiotic chromosome segregation protein [Mycena vulgaris]